MIGVKDSSQIEMFLQFRQFKSYPGEQTDIPPSEYEQNQDIGAQLD